MYSNAEEAIIAQRLNSPLDDQIAGTGRARRRRPLTITFRPTNNRGGQL